MVYNSFIFLLNILWFMIYHHLNKFFNFLFECLSFRYANMSQSILLPQHQVNIIFTSLSHILQTDLEQLNFKNYHIYNLQQSSCSLNWSDRITRSMKYSDWNLQLGKPLEKLMTIENDSSIFWIYLDIVKLYINCFHQCLHIKVLRDETCWLKSSLERMKRWINDDSINSSQTFIHGFSSSVTWYSCPHGVTINEELQQR